MMLRVRCILVLSCLLLVPAAARAQLLVGDWVRQNERDITAARMTPIRIIVLDREGRPAAGARVQITQQRHDFEVGFVVPEDGWPVYAPHEPVWRCFNAASLERHTAWHAAAPRQGEPESVDGLAPLMAAAAARDMSLRWGPVISADPARLPDWAVALRGEDMVRTVNHHLSQSVGLYGDRVASFDLYADALDHDLIERRLGAAMVRRVYERAESLSPDARLLVRFDDALERRRAAEVVKRVLDLQRDFVPLDGVAIDSRFADKVTPQQLGLSLRRFAALDVAVEFSSLEVGGESSIDAALNMETVLRVIFAAEHIEGVYFAALSPEQTLTPHASLFDERGEPTAGGSVLDRLMHGQWWTEVSAKADEIGELSLRVYAGVHDLTATLPDGSSATTRIHAPMSATPRIVVLQPLTFQE